MVDFSDFAPDPEAAPVNSGRFISTSVQAERDAEGLRIRQRELDDPSVSNSDKAALRREIARMGQSWPNVGGGASRVKAAKALDFHDFAPVPEDITTALPAPTPTTTTPTRSAPTGVGDLLAKTGREFVALGDLVAGIPAQLIGIGADMGMRARAIGHGSTRAEQAEAGAGASTLVNEKLGAPISKLLNLAGLGAAPGERTNVDAALGKVAEWLGKGGEWVEKNTNGLLVKGDVESIVNAAMGAAGGRGLAAGLRKIVPEGVVVSKPRVAAPPVDRIPDMPEDAPTPAPVAPVAPPAPIRSSGPRSRQRGAVDMEAFIPRKEGEPGLSLKEFEGLSPALPLASLLQRSDYTLKTLDRLPQNKTEFSRSHIEQELKRADVTDAERGAINSALEQFPGDKITAKDLVVGVKRATGDFELAAKKTDEYADYGLEGIGRYSEGSRDLDAWHDTTPDERAAARLQEVPATTTLYRLPEHMTLSDANHFSDPNLFGWTRSFMEDGKRHVVEIQSDLAQHAKEISPEEAADVLAKQAVWETKIKAVGENWGRYRHPSPEEAANVINALDAVVPGTRKAAGEYFLSRGHKLEAEPLDNYLAMKKMAFDETAALEDHNAARTLISDFAEKLKRDLELERGELRAKEGSAKARAIAPILKSWPKRLVREELAQAADAGERSVRFATADTVAKVEGWPDQRYGAEQRVGSPRYTPEHQSIYDRYRRDIEKFTTQLGGKPVTDASGHTWIEVPVPRRGPKQMFGAADTELLKPLAGAAVGAALGLYLDREPGDTGLGGAVLGGLAGAFAGSRGGTDFAKGAVHLADRGLGLISTRIRNISEPVLHRAMEFERRVLSDTHERIAYADPFLVALKKAKSPALERAIKTNDAAEVARLMPPSMRVEWARTRAMLDEVGARLKDGGLLSNLRDDYFPRVVKDRTGLLESLGAAERSGLQQALLGANTKAVRAGRGALDAVEESAVINKYLTNRTRAARPGFTKQRAITAVTEALDPYYASNAEALHSYVAAATQAIERARFFGKDLVTKVDDGRTTVDLNSSIGRVVQREVELGKVDPKHAEELSEILRARFSSRPQSGVVQDIKNAANLGLLGNVISAGTQLGDLGTAVYMEGLRPSLEALGRSLSARNRITVKDFGLVDHISEEFASTRGSAKVLNAAFRLSGFSWVDSLGKNVLLNAALSKFQKLAQTAKGVQQLTERFGNSFGDDLPALVTELRSGRIGEQTRAALFQELSRAQPITKLEVPQAYLEMPNGRMLYMLKTFMLKQADIVRRDAYNEIKAGHKARGLGNLAKYAVILGVSGMATDAVKNWLLGKPIDFSTPAIAMNMLKTFGLSQYVLDKARQGKPLEAALGLATPPYKMMDDIIRDNSAASRYVPIIGPLLYSHAFGGADQAQAKAGAAAKKTGQTLTEEQRAAMARSKERRRLERQKRKEMK